MKNCPIQRKFTPRGPSPRITHKCRSRSKMKNPLSQFSLPHWMLSKMVWHKPVAPKIMELQDFRERPGCRPRPTQWGLCSSITHPKVTCHKQAKPVSFIYCSLVNLHFLQHRRTDTKWIKFVTKDELQCLKVFYISQSHPILTVISELR